MMKYSVLQKMSSGIGAVLGNWGCSQGSGLFSGIENRKSVFRIRCSGFGDRDSEIGNQKLEIRNQKALRKDSTWAVLGIWGCSQELGLSWHLGCP